MSVNEKIRLVREAKGLTQEQMAEKLEISRNSYGEIERGDTDVKLSKLEKIAEQFEMKLSELVDLSDKGTINVDFSNQRNSKSKPQNHVYVGSCASELKEQKLLNEMKDKEIALLKEIIELLKAKNEVTK